MRTRPPAVTAAEQSTAAADAAEASAALAPPGATTAPSPHRFARALHSRLGSLPRAFWFLWTGTLVNRLGTFVEPFLILYLTDARGLSLGRAGLILTLYGVGSLCAQLLGGVLADRIGRRATMLVSLLSSAGALLLLGAARDPTLLAVAAVVMGLTGDLYRPAAGAFVADIVPPDQRPRAYGLLFWAINLGFAGATIAAGFLATVGYGLLFVVDAATCAIFAGVLAIGIRESRPQQDRPAGGTRPPGLGAALRDRVMLAFTGLALVFACIYFQVFVTLPLAMRDDGLGPAAYGAVIAVNGVLIVILQPLLINWLAARSRTLVLAGSHLLVGLGFGSTAFADSIPLYALTVVVWTLGEIGSATVAATVVADLAPEALRGRYMGLFGLAFGAAGVIAPGTGTLIFDRLGTGALGAACAVTGVALAVGQVALGPAISRRTGRSVLTA